VDIDLTGGYSAYFIRMTNIVFSVDGSVPALRTSTDGGTTFDSGATDYAYDLRRYDSSTVQTSRATGAAYGLLTQTVGNDTGESLNGEILSGNITSGDFHLYGIADGA
jgi:hypothetical protein